VGAFRSPSSARGEGTAKAGGRRCRGMRIVGGMGIMTWGERRLRGRHWVRAGTGTHPLPPSHALGAQGRGVIYPWRAPRAASRLLYAPAGLALG
jgi:hypothetical protein